MSSFTKEQLDAINKDNTNILVSAGAGSGKTAVLSERVIRKVKDGININRILILTFTEAASFEMKERIRKKLINNKLFDQVDLIDNSYITTFDSFSLNLVKKYHETLNLNKDIKIIDSNLIDFKKSEILDSIFLDYYNSGNKLFLKLINDFCVKDDKSLKEWIININNKLDLKYNKIDYLKSYIDNYFNEDFYNKTFNEYKDLVFSYIDNIKNNLKELENHLSLDEINNFYMQLDGLLTVDNYDLIKINLDINLPRLSNKSEDMAKTIKSNINNNLSKIKELVVDTEENEILIYKNTKDYVEIIIDIILKLDKKILDFKYKNNSFEFIDIEKIIIKLVLENEFIKNEISESFDEIMIDEYQDTSDLQEVFIKSISNNNIYMVGDIKQAIYSFRNANPDIFKEKYDLYSNNKNGYKIDLNKNFRSRMEVLDNINLIFENVMTEKFGQADYKNSHKMIFGNTTYLDNVLNNNYNMKLLNYNYNKDINYNKDEIEAFIIANDIKNKINNNYLIYDKDKNVNHELKYSDITILVDKSKSFNLYKKIFEYLDIPLTIYKDYDITEDYELYLIKNILTLLKCVSDNNYSDSFKHAFISVLRSYLYSLDDNIIFNYFINNNYLESDLIKKIKIIKEKVDVLDLKNLIVLIIDEFNFREKLFNINNIKLRESVLEIIINDATSLSEIGYDYIDFYNYLQKIIDDKKRKSIKINMNDSDSVKIMTIHHSKGLEYNICYYPSLTNTFNKVELNNKILFSNEYGFIIPYYNNFYKETYLKRLYKHKFLLDQISERIRLFYVSLTRCKEEMIFITNIDLEKENFFTEEVKESYNSFNSILGSIKHILKDYFVFVDLDKIGLTKDYKNIKNYKELEFDLNNLNINDINYENDIIKNNKFSKDLNNLLEIDIKNNIEYGKYLHTIFEYLDFKNINYELISEDEKKYINNFLNQDILKNINNSLNIYHEYEFIYNIDSISKHGIIDLMIEYDSYIDIIDFKLKNITDSNYLKQLNGYKEYIFNKTKKEVNIYLYSIIDNQMEKL